MAAWSDGYWWSADGLRLHYRDYAGRDDRPPILCIPGLTRNARDFADLADRLAGEWRLICVDLRGRGESAFAKDPLSYVPLTYVQDVGQLLSELKLDRYILFGTSLGGLVAMLMQATGVRGIAGVLLNDVGPELDPAGMVRIGSYVGRQVNYPTWLHAARAVAASNAHVYPDYELADWVAMAKRLCRLTPAGRIVYDYDMKIAEPFRMPVAGSPVDLWPAFDSLRTIPATLIQGALSDLLSPAIAGKMAKRHPDLDAVVIPRVGHAPTLGEPLAIAAIDRLLARIKG